MKDNRKSMKKSLDGWWLTIDEFMNVKGMSKEQRQNFYYDVEQMTNNMINEIYHVCKKYDEFSKLKNI